jgi:hypothetical protein
MFNNALLMAAASSQGGGPAHTVSNSVILDDGDTAYFSRTNATPTDQKKWTYSTWIKRGNLDTRQTWGLSATSSGTSYFQFYGHPSTGTGDDDRLYINVESDGTSGGTALLRTNGYYSDPHAWYHFVVVYDSDNSTADLRCRLYINGVEITTFGTNTVPALGSTGVTNKGGITQLIGKQAGSTNYFDGYIAEAVFCDGQAYEAADFGEYSSSGLWRPRNPSGLTFGNNGFYLDFADSSALGNDVSGNNNDWTANNLAAGDQSTDTPTNNQCVLTPVWKSSSLTLSQGNLKLTSASNDYHIAMSSMQIPSSGKWVMEWYVAAADTYPASSNFYIIGVIQVGNNNTLSGAASGYFINIGTGEIVKNNAVVVDTGGPINGTIRVEYDAGADTIKFFDDGTEVFPASTGTSNTVGLTGQDNLHFGIGCYLTAVATFSNLSGTPTTDFKELSAANLDTPTIDDSSKYFQPTLYTGNGSVRNIDQSGNSTFQPDFVWLKNRSQADSHALFDVGQGVTKYFSTDSAAQQITNSNSLTSFDSDGFGLGTGAGGFNDSSENFVAWQWKAGGGAGSSNEDGSINTTSTSVDQTSGTSISIYTGNATSGATVGHGLGAVPQMIIIKPLDATEGTAVYHVCTGNTKGGYMNMVNGFFTGTYYWNDTSPTSSVFSLGNHVLNNGSGKTMVAYAFANKTGFSRFGKYYGTGSSTIPPLVTMDFKPSLVLIKNSGATGDWLLYDNVRSPSNIIEDQLLANSAAAETTGSEEISFLSNGFAPAATDASINTSGNTYLYAAWAANPFGGEDTIPSTAY